MKRCVSIAFAIVVSAVSAAAATPDEPGIVRVGMKPALEAGRQQVILSVYATREGGTPLGSETRSVQVDAHGVFTAPLGDLASRLSSSSGERWLGVQVMPRAEAPRVKLESRGSLPVILQFQPVAAISANGLVESIAQGFRFPDGSVQTSAATVSGGVPSVNGIGSAVSIVGAGTVSVGTVGSTITVTGAGAYVRTIIVSPVVGNPTASGTALTTALNAISSNSSTDPYLLKIEPGVYSIGNNALTMKSYVDIEGSGENATFITATRGDANCCNTTLPAAVIGAANSELRNLTVTNTSPSDNGIAFYSSGAGTRRISNVTINSTGGTNVSYGVYATSSATVTAFHATVTATSAGSTGLSIGFAGLGNATIINILNSTVKGVGGGGSLTINIAVDVSSSCVATIDSSTIVATGTGGGNYGVYASTGTTTVTNSTVRVDSATTRQAVATSGVSSSILNVSHSLLLAGNSTNSLAVSISKGISSTLRVATSLVDSSSLGTPTCVYNYDSSFNATSCPGPIS